MKPTYGPVAVAALCAAAMLGFSAAAQTDAASVGGFILAAVLAAVAVTHATEVARDRRAARARLADTTVARLERRTGR